MPPKTAQNFHRIFTKLIFVTTKIRKYPLIAIFAIGGLIFFVLGLISLLASNRVDQGIIFEDYTASSSATLKGILVDVEGAVVKPGVYRITGDARIKDAFIAAGGLAENADRSFVSKNINLAQKLTDGAKVYVPDKNQNAKVKSQNYQGGDVNTQININTASLGELDGLPGVGAVTAQKIIDNRPYTSIDELVNKKAVSKSVFEKIKEKIHE